MFVGWSVDLSNSEVTSVLKTSLKSPSCPSKIPGSFGPESGRD